jgi:hypothetical protein
MWGDGVMLPVLQFIFSSFWTWSGTAVLMLIATEGVTRLFGAALIAVARK